MHGDGVGEKELYRVQHAETGPEDGDEGDGWGRGTGLVGVA